MCSPLDLFPNRDKRYHRFDGASQQESSSVGIAGLALGRQGLVLRMQVVAPNNIRKSLRREDFPVVLAAESAARNLIGKTRGDPDKLATRNHSLSFQEDLELETNSRFGFSFLYPKNWDRRDPHGSDGNIYTHPKDSGIEMRAWGGYAVVSPTLENWFSRTMELETQKSGFRILRETESGRHVYYQKQTRTIFQGAQCPPANLHRHVAVRLSTAGGLHWRASTERALPVSEQQRH